MQLPFKYIVLSIIKTLKNRKMSLDINRSVLFNYLKLLMNKSYFTIEEKKIISDNFDFDYEVDDLVEKYFQYFVIDGDLIKFDSDYIDDIDNLINEEINKFDLEIIHDIDFAVKSDVIFLETLGVKVEKGLYMYLLSLEKQIEDYYDKMFDSECNIRGVNIDNYNTITEIKKLKLKQIIMLFNTKNLLSNTQYQDLMLYASNMADDTNELDDINLLIEDDQFNEEDILYDIFLRSVFTGSESSVSNLRDKIIIIYSGLPRSRKYSRIKFIFTFLELLDREIEKSDELLNIELIRIKYRVMNVVDTVYDTNLFMNNNNICCESTKEDYYFINDAVYYFINELLMYDDSRYKNKEFNTDNIMVYLNSIMKKLIINTYYKLTGDMKVIDEIKNNKLYGVNNISTGLLKEIINKPKTKVKEI